MYTKQQLDLLEYRLETLLNNSMTYNEWFDFAENDIKAIFGNRSKQWYKLVEVYREYYSENGKIRTKSKIDETPYILQSQDHLKEFIKEVRDELKQQKPLSSKTFPALPAELSPTVKSDKKEHSSMFSNGLFWTIVGGAFLFGLYVGNVKYDKDKINLDKENEILKKELQSARDTTNIIKDSISYWKQVYQGGKSDVLKYRRFVPKDIVDSVDNLIY